VRVINPRYRRHAATAILESGINLHRETPTDMDTKPQFKEHRVPRGRGNVYARDYAGSGPAFVLLHGFPDNLHIYDEVVPYLVAAGRRVVTFDFLGYGASDKPAVEYSFKRQQEDLEAVVETLRLETIVPVGHDAGGTAAINFSIDHSDRVASLCLLNTFYGAATAIRLPELIELFATASLRGLADAILDAPDQLAFVLRFQQKKFLLTLPEGQKASFESILAPIINNNFNFGRKGGSGPAFAQMAAQVFEQVARNTERLPELERLDIPVKCIWGDTDMDINTGIARDLQSHLKHSSLRILSAGHWPQIDMPKEVANEMLS
jgi:haloalkane dehalogenase